MTRNEVGECEVSKGVSTLNGSRNYRNFLTQQSKLCNVFTLGQKQLKK